MGKIDCLSWASFQSIAKLKSLKGLEFWFWSHDHIPPHFNVRRIGHWEIKVNIDLTTADKLSWQYTYPKKRGKRFHGFTGQQERQLNEFIKTNRDRILLEWEQKVCVSENLNNA